MWVMQRPGKLLDVIVAYFDEYANELSGLVVLRPGKMSSKVLFHILIDWVMGMLLNYNFDINSKQSHMWQNYDMTNKQT